MCHLSHFFRYGRSNSSMLFSVHIPSLNVNISVLFLWVVLMGLTGAILGLILIIWLRVKVADMVYNWLAVVQTLASVTLTRCYQNDIVFR